MKLIKELSIITLVSIFLVSCDAPESPLLTSLRNHNVVIGSGFNAKNREHVVFSPLNGTEVKPCRLPPTTKNTNVQAPIHPKGCGLEIVEGVNSELIKNAIKASENLNIPAEIIINGVKKQADFKVTVTALYKGSLCGTIYHGGLEYYCCNNTCSRA